MYLKDIDLKFYKNIFFLKSHKQFLVWNYINIIKMKTHLILTSISFLSNNSLIISILFFSIAKCNPVISFKKINLKFYLKKTDKISFKYQMVWISFKTIILNFIKTMNLTLLNDKEKECYSNI